MAILADIADRITREHKISSVGGNGRTEIARGRS